METPGQVETTTSAAVATTRQPPTRRGRCNARCGQETDPCVGPICIRATSIIDAQPFRVDVCWFRRLRGMRGWTVYCWAVHCWMYLADGPSLDRFTPGRPSSYAGYPRHLMTPPAPTTPLGTAAMPAGWRTTSRATSRWRRGSIACAGCDADAHRATRQPKTRSVVLGDRPTSAHRMVS
jgi:hypothetical protein